VSFWESLRESDNPAALQAYLEKYPDGEFKSLAEIRFRELSAPPFVRPSPLSHSPPRQTPGD
jgi:hypothetical protein